MEILRVLISLIFALLVMVSGLTELFAYDMLVLQSRRDSAYDEVLSGFRSERNISQRVVVLSDYSEVDIVRIRREDQPRVILAVGDAALKTARRVSAVPVVSVMSLAIHRYAGSAHNLTGVGIYAQPQIYMSLFKSMRLRRVGVVYNPARSGWYLQQARQVAAEYGVELVTREVSDSRDVVARVQSLSGKVDALWMLPDITAVTRETTEAYFRFGQEHSLPVVSFAGSYLGLGAAAAVEIERSGLGRQAADITASLLAGRSAASMPLRFPASTSIKKNTRVIKRLSY